MQASTMQVEGTWPETVASRAGMLLKSTSHVEGLARAHFLVDEQKQLGLLVGEQGSGKSTLLSALGEELKRF